MAVLDAILLVVAGAVLVSTATSPFGLHFRSATQPRGGFLQPALATTPVDCWSPAPEYALVESLVGPSNNCAFNCHYAGCDWGCLADNRTCMCRCDHQAYDLACSTACPLLQPGKAFGFCNATSGYCVCTDTPSVPTPPILSGH